jgi:hypothetical protein
MHVLSCITGDNDSNSDDVDSIPAMSITSESAAAVILAEPAAKQGGFRMRQPVEVCCVTVYYIIYHVALCYMYYNPWYC